MRKWIEWFADNTVAANLLLIVVLAGGVLSMLGLRQEIVPEIDAEMVTVSVPYPGASPSEVEKSICIKIEERVTGLSGVKRVTSTASEGIGTVIVELMTNANDTKLLGDIKNEVDAISTFPDDAEEPIVSKLSMDRQVLTVVVSGDAEERVLKEYGERLRDEIGAIQGITKVELTATRPYEISIEVDEARLREYRLTFDEVANAVRRSSLDIPGGTVRSSGGQVLLRSIGQAYEGEDFESILLRSTETGQRLYLRDVATVRDDFAETDSASRFDDKPAVFVDVYRTGDQSAITIAELVREFIKERSPQLPAGISLEIARDDVKFLEGRIDLLVRNGQMGFILVLISLALFLRLKLALWVTVGVPLSFLGAFWLLPGMEVSINMISLFGFIVVLGIVVDDAIVIGENVYSHLQRGKTPLQAAKEGALEVATPVLFAVLTTIAAFSVMLGIEGTMGQFSRNIPLVVIACLAFSVVEAFFILPAHLRHLKAEGEQKHRGHLQAVACVPGHLHRRPAPLDQEGLRAVAGLAAPLALRDDRRLYRHAARQRRPRDQRRNQVRLLPARRERHHRRGLDDAARHTCRGDAARSRQAAGEHPLRRSRSRRRSQAGRGHRAARAHFGRFAALCRCAATEYGRHRRERVGVAHRRSDGRAGPRRRA
jgi:multidrug efflux pump subunit AcrB